MRESKGDYVLLSYLEPPSRLERYGNVTDIYKPEGEYTLIYGLHTVAASKPIDPTTIPDNLDGVFIETATNTSWVADPAGVFEFIRYGFAEYSRVFPKLKRLRTPLYFADLAFIDERADIAEAMIYLGESMAGLKLLASGFSRDNRPLNRRRLLQKAVQVVAGSWFIVPFPVKGLLAGSEISNIGVEQSLQLDKFLNKIHPEFDPFSVTLRNITLAYKEEWLMERLGHAHLGTIEGAGHVGLEDQLLRTQREKLDDLRKLKPIIPQIVDPKTFYSILELGFDGNALTIDTPIEIPELKELVS